MKIGKLILNIIKAKISKENAKKCNKLVFDPKYNPKRDISYIDDGNDYHKFDLYYTPVKDKKNCLVIDIHGGAYIFGHRKENYMFGTVFLDAGFDFIAVDYIPNDGNHSINDIVDQCVKCISYIANHLNEYGFSSDYKIVLTGDSAGGHIASTIAELFLDKEYAGLLGYSLPTINIKALAINCPVFKFVGLGKDALTKSGLKRMLGPQYNDKEKAALICPATHIDSLSVPLFVSTSKNDFIRTIGAESVLPYMKDNKDFEYLYIEDESAGHVHNIIDITSEPSKKVNQAMIDFFTKSINN
ncbi:MAG: alpha/beta hydrolase [Erysipelotrichaceae bacterium]|nr:alpha/beta hydrolase [Erysipelotrichaceae bacterium]